MLAAQLPLSSIKQLFFGVILSSWLFNVSSYTKGRPAAHIKQLIYQLLLITYISATYISATYISALTFDLGSTQLSNVSIYTLLRVCVGAANGPLQGDIPWNRWGRVIDVGGAYGSVLAAVLTQHPGMRGALFDQQQV